MKSNIMEEIANPSFMNSPWHKVSLPFTTRKLTFIGFYLFSFYFFNHKFDLLFIGFYFFSLYFSISDIKKKPSYFFFSTSRGSCHFWNPIATFEIPISHGLVLFITTEKIISNPWEKGTTLQPFIGSSCQPTSYKLKQLDNFYINWEKPHWSQCLYFSNNLSHLGYKKYNYLSPPHQKGKYSQNWVPHSVIGLLTWGLTISNEKGCSYSTTLKYFLLLQ